MEEVEQFDSISIEELAEGAWSMLRFVPACNKHEPCLSRITGELAALRSNVVRAEPL
jgi:hypothetical protein